MEGFFNMVLGVITVLFFLTPTLVLFFKLVEDELSFNEFFLLCLPFIFSLAGWALTRESPLRFFFWLTCIGFWVGLPIYFIYLDRQTDVTMLEEDLEKCHRLIAFDPDNGAAYAQLGRLYTRQKKSVEAVEAYAKAVELEPHNKKYQWNLKKARSQQERAEEQEDKAPEAELETETPEFLEEQQTEEEAPEEAPAQRVQKAIQTLQLSEQECPRCPHTQLHAASWQEVPLQGCSRCGGFWFQKGPLARLLTSHQGTFSDLQALFGRQWSPSRQDRASLICPLCQSPLRPVTAAQAPHLVLQGCLACQGIWLEHGQLGQLEEGPTDLPKETPE